MLVGLARTMIEKNGKEECLNKRKADLPVCSLKCESKRITKFSSVHVHRIKL
jgi:hypothetical protein